MNQPKVRYCALILLILFSSVASSFFIKTLAIIDEHNRNIKTAEFLCSSSQLNSQIGSYRELAENIQSFFEKFDLNNSSMNLRVGGQQFYTSTIQISKAEKFDCKVNGRDDIDLSLFIEKSPWIDINLVFYFLKFSIFYLLLFSFSAFFLKKYGNVLSEYLIGQIQYELGLTEEKLDQKRNSIGVVLLKLFDLKKARHDVLQLKETIENQNIQIQISKTQKAIMKQEMVKNIEFSDKVDAFVHDLKSPIGLISALSTKTEVSDLPSYLGRLKLRMDSLLENLTKTRDQYRESNAFLRVDDLVGIIESTIQDQLLSCGLPKNRIFLENKIPTTHFSKKVPILKRDLPRHLSNIFNNSLEANANKIVVRLSDGNYFLNIIVFDDGDGIESQHLDEVFNKGFTVNKNEGTGEGLYQLKKFITSISGKVILECPPGAGTRLTIHLPFC